MVTVKLRVAKKGMSLEARAVEISLENMCCRVLRTVGCLSISCTFELTQELNRV